MGHLVHGSLAPRGFFLRSAIRPLTLGGKPLSFLVEVVSDKTRAARRVLSSPGPPQTDLPHPITEPRHGLSDSKIIISGRAVDTGSRPSLQIAQAPRSSRAANAARRADEVIE